MGSTLTCGDGSGTDGHGMTNLWKMHVPSYVGILGNERDDILTKAATGDRFTYHCNDTTDGEINDHILDIVDVFDGVSIACLAHRPYCVLNSFKLYIENID